MTESKIQTNMELTAVERLALKYASGYPYSHGAIVGGVRALIADWQARGRPSLPWPKPEPVAEVEL